MVDFLLADKDVVVLFLRGVSWCGRKGTAEELSRRNCNVFSTFHNFCMDRLFV